MDFPNEIVQKIMSYLPIVEPRQKKICQVIRRIHQLKGICVIDDWLLSYLHQFLNSNVPFTTSLKLRLKMYASKVFNVPESKIPTFKQLYAYESYHSPCVLIELYTNEFTDDVFNEFVCFLLHYHS